LFKKLYNLECEKVDSDSNIKIDNIKINDYNIINCIYENIKYVKNRYFLTKNKTIFNSINIIKKSYFSKST